MKVIIKDVDGNEKIIQADSGIFVETDRGSRYFVFEPVFQHDNEDCIGIKAVEAKVTKLVTFTDTCAQIGKEQYSF